MGDDITIGVTEIVNNIEVTAQPNDQIVELSVVDNADDVTLNITPTVIEINVNKGSSYAKWGTILGTLSDQEDLQDALDLKADLVDGKVPSSQLPSYVDDVIEVADYESLPTTGESGKIYITLDDNHIYRWTGSTYVEITDNTSVWGAITGTLSSQTDLQSALNAKALKTTTISTNSPLSGGGDLSANRTLSISQASASVDGYLSSTDWNTFNSKLSSLSGAVLTTTDQNISGVKTFTDLAKFTNGSGSFAIEIDVTTSGALVVKDTGTTKLQIGKNGEILAAKYKISGGFSSQFLKANGDLDSTIYTPASRTLTINGTSYDLSTDRSWTIATHDAVTIGTANGLSLSGQALSLALASSSTNGALSSSDWNTFNGKQNALTNPITGSLTTNYLPKATGSTTLGNSLIYDNGTNVGIGTTSPARPLTIRSAHATASATTYTGALLIHDEPSGVSPHLGMGVAYNSGNQHSWIQSNNTDGYYSLCLNPAGGNVGIGTTSPSDKLDLFGAIRLTRTDDTAQYSTIQSNSNGSFIATSYRPYAGAGNYGDFRFEGKDSTGATATQLYINTNGRVGIGTTSPSNKLSVFNTLGLPSSSALSEAIILVQDSGSNRRLGIGSSTSGQWIQSAYPGVEGAASNLLLNPSGGNVGIGTTSPLTKLHIEGDNSSTVDETVLTLRGNGENGKRIDFRNAFGSLARITGTKLAAGASADDGILTFETATNSVLSEKMRITDLGNVGIGTHSPSGTLEVNTNSTFAVASTFGNKTGNRLGVLNDDGGNRIQLDAYNSTGASNFVFATGGSERMRIKSNGIINIDEMPYYANNAAALSGGLTYGDLYYDDNANVKIVINLG